MSSVVKSTVISVNLYVIHIFFNDLNKQTSISSSYSSQKVSCVIQKHVPN